MPSVQVKDFPQDLYEQLKAYAEANHRSMAQQLVVAAEQMLLGNNGVDEDRKPSEALLACGLVPRSFDAAEREGVIAKRKALFAQTDALRESLKEQGSAFLSPQADELADTLRESRDSVNRHTGGPLYNEANLKAKL